MSKANAVQCPISVEKVDENIVRIVAFYVIIAALFIFFYNTATIALLLCIDFGLRAFAKGKWSPLKYLSVFTNKNIVRANPKITNAAPKKFAAILGFVVSTAIFIFLLLGFITITKVFAAMIIVFAFLESAFRFCVGCYVYAYLVLPFKK